MTSRDQSASEPSRTPHHTDECPAAQLCEKEAHGRHALADQQLEELTAMLAWSEVSKRAAIHSEYEKGLQSIKRRGCISCEQAARGKREARCEKAWVELMRQESAAAREAARATRTRRCEYIVRCIQERWMRAAATHASGQDVSCPALSEKKLTRVVGLCMEGIPAELSDDDFFARIDTELSDWFCHVEGTTGMHGGERQKMGINGAKCCCRLAETCTRKENIVRAHVFRLDGQMGLLPCCKACNNSRNTPRMPCFKPERGAGWFHAFGNAQAPPPPRQQQAQEQGRPQQRNNYVQCGVHRSNGAANGRPLYRGRNGGKFYFTPSGSKTYV